MSTNKTVIYAFLFAALFFGLDSTNQAQDSDDSVVIGTVLGLKRPDLMGWIMHRRHLDEYYVRVDKVVKGTVSSKYIVIGYPYNDEDKALPSDILSNKYRWKFRIGRMAEWDQTAVPILGEAKVKEPAKSTEKADQITQELIEDLKLGENTFTIVPVTYWIDTVKGFETEAASLEKLGKLKAYFLGRDKGNPKRLNR